MSLPVTAVDFLPADFHAQRLRRRACRMRWGIAGAFVALTALGLIGNQVNQSRLHLELHRLRPQAAALAELEASLVQIEREMEIAQLKADVRSRLRLRTASSRLIASVTASLPKGVALTEIECHDERPTNAPSSPSRTKEDGPAKLPEQLDLERLLTTRTRQIVTVRGLAQTDGTISKYLDGLRLSGTFDEVNLLFTDRYEKRGASLRTFSVRLRVRRPIPAPSTDALVARGDA